MAQRRILHDEFFKRAKAEGYVARSAYKLLEIQERHRLIRPGDWVLDLGCAPGSWMQVAERLAVGERPRPGSPPGVVVGIDLSQVEHKGFGPRVCVLQGDAFLTQPEDLLGAAASVAGAPPRPFDVVLSDMAPNTTGHGDDFLSVRLCRRVLELASKVLRPGGNLAMKVLEGEEYPALLRETKAAFRDAKGLKPRASRDVSREIFIVGMGFAGVPGPAPAPTNVAKTPPTPPRSWSTS